MSWHTQTSSSNANAIAFRNDGSSTQVWSCVIHRYDPGAVTTRGTNGHRRRWSARCWMCGNRLVWKDKPPRHWKPEP